MHFSLTIKLLLIGPHDTQSVPTLMSEANEHTLSVQGSFSTPGKLKYLSRNLNLSHIVANFTKQA